MRTRQEYIDILKSHADVLRTTYGISYMRLFDLAGNCMTIMAIGDGFRKLLNATVFLIDYFGKQNT